MICLLPSFPVAYDRPKPLTVAGAALVLGPDMGHPHQIPVSVPNALHPMNTLHTTICVLLDGSRQDRLRRHSVEYRHL